MTCAFSISRLESLLVSRKKLGVFVVGSCALCVGGEGVQGVLTLFCSGAAQVCHDDRGVELKEQLEVEEEDGDRQEEKVEVEREQASQGECAMLITMDGDLKMRSELEP